MSRDLIEHIRMLNTFSSDKKAIDPIFLQLFGDIFQEQTLSNDQTFLIEDTPSNVVVFKYSIHYYFNRKKGGKKYYKLVLLLCKMVQSVTAIFYTNKIELRRRWDYFISKQLYPWQFIMVIAALVTVK